MTEVVDDPGNIYIEYHTYIEKDTAAISLLISPSIGLRVD